MDYKEQIEELRFLSGHVPEQMCDADGKDPLEKAADAIETLLAERDAAVEHLSHGGSRCNCCAYNYHSIHDYPCKHCKETGGMSDYWEWRGPQKEDKHEAD